MYPSIALSLPRQRIVPMAAILVAMTTLWFGLLALAAPFDHDESQYIAGADLSTRLFVFRDFLYLQPPLHAWANAPLAWIFPGHIVVAMRLATGVTAVGTLAILWSAQRAGGVSRESAAIATLLIATTAAFQFTASVVRNDMLPTGLSAMGMACALMALRHGTPARWIAAGLCFGLAISTKLNFAPLGLAVGLFVLTTGGRCGVRAAIWLGIGGLMGLIPMMLAVAAAPEAFRYGALTYGVTAPMAWYAANGAGQELSGFEKLTDLFKYSWKGPMAAALIAIAGHWVTTSRHSRSPGRRLANWMTAGACVGVALPTPTQLQYLMPLIPSVALSLGCLLDDARRWAPSSRQILMGLLSAATVPALLPVSHDLFAMGRHGSPVMASTQGAHWAGKLVMALIGKDSIVTLSPHMAVDSGLKLDPRLATGPFVYRSGWTITPDEARRFHALTPAILHDLNNRPPAAILAGYEQGTRKLPLRPDDGLIAYARQHGYRLFAMPDGIGQLYVRDKTHRSPILR